MKKIWGFAEPVWNSYGYSEIQFLPENLCEAKRLALTEQLVQFVNQASLKDKAVLTTILQKTDTISEALAQGDLTGDVIEDEVILVKDDKFGEEQVLAIIQQPDRLAATPIIPATKVRSFRSPAKLSSLHIDDTSPLLNFLDLNDNTLVIFYIDQPLTVPQARIIFNQTFDHYTLNLNVVPPELIIEEYNERERFTWNSERRRFIYEGTEFIRPPFETYSQAEQSLIHLEEGLFDFVNFPQAMKLPSDHLPTLAQFDPYSIRSLYPPPPKEHAIYHLGLAYELNGDEDEAVQTYWQLWHDYPDSPYTLLAQRKLERVEP